MPLQHLSMNGNYILIDIGGLYNMTGKTAVLSIQGSVKIGFNIKWNVNQDFQAYRYKPMIWPVPAKK